MIKPQRWHVYVVDLQPRVGTKPGKQRPCLAIQPSEFGEAGLASTVILPLTTKIVGQKAPPPRAYSPGRVRLAQESDVMIDQILAWDNELFGEDLGVLPEGLQDEVRRALLEFLDREVPVLLRMFEKRLRTYRAIGYARGEAALTVGMRRRSTSGRSSTTKKHFATSRRQRGKTQGSDRARRRSPSTAPGPPRLRSTG